MISAGSLRILQSDGGRYKKLRNNVKISIELRS